MSNKFEVQVVALDRFTNIFRRLNERASHAVRPIANTKRQMAGLFRELHLPKLTAGIGSLTRGAQTLAASLGAAAAPLQSVLGLGAAGGLLAGVAAATAMSGAWASAGSEVKRTSKALDMSTTEVQGWRGAAKLAGVETDAMTGAMLALGQVLQDAAFGRNPQAVMLLKSIGADIRKSRAGVVDVAATANDLADALARIADPNVRRVIAGAFGIEAALPYFERGSREMARLRDEADKLGGVMGADAIERAERLARSWDKLGVAAAGLRNRIAEKLGLDKLADFMAQMMSPDGATPATAGDFDRINRMGERAPNTRRGDGGATGSWAPLLTDGINVSSAHGARMVRHDVANGAQFSSPEVARRVAEMAGVEIKVNVANAPAGTTVTATSSGPPVRVQRTMEGADW
jgi:hypothetical protein